MESKAILRTLTLAASTPVACSWSDTLPPQTPKVTCSAGGGPATYLRLDPLGRTGCPNNGTKEGGQQSVDRFQYQFWRFLFAQQLMTREIQTLLDSPPMQRGASMAIN